MAWFNGNQGLSVHSHSSVADSSERKESISESIHAIQQTLQLLQAKMGCQDSSIGEECNGPFHSPYHEPYQQLSFQPSFQSHYPPHPPYRSYHEPSPPPYNPYHEPHSNPPLYNHMPYHDPSTSFHSTFQPCHPPHEPLFPPFQPSYGHHSQPCVPLQEPSIGGVIGEFQKPMTCTINEEQSHKDTFSNCMASIMRSMEQRDKERASLDKDFERLTQPLKEAEGWKKDVEQFKKNMELLSQKISKCITPRETLPPLPTCNPPIQATKVKKVRFQLLEESSHPVEEEQEVQPQGSNATSQVEDFGPPVPIPTQTYEVEQVQNSIEESSLPFGNDPILIEVDSSTTLTSEAIPDLSDDEVDEEIIVESPQIFENIIAQPLSSSSSDSIVVVDDCASTSLYDASIVENASLHSTRDDCGQLNDISSCSCAVDQICVDCYHDKCHLLVEFRKKAFSEVVDSTVHLDTSPCTIDVFKHDTCENVESCMDANVIVVSDKNHSLGKDLTFDSNELLDSIIREDSTVLIDNITNENDSFHMILSCDLPPDIEKENDSFESSKVLGGHDLKNSPSSSTLFPSISCDCNDDVVYPNIKLDSAPSTLQTQENLTVCLTPIDGRTIDFLGCDSYLESLELNMPLLYLKSLHVSIFGWDTAGCLYSLQTHSWKGHRRSQHPPYILGPLPIDPEPPPPRKSNAGEVVFKDKCMILIRDENFSFKRVKIL